MIRAAQACLALLALALLPAAAPAPVIIDLTDDFAQVYAATKSLPPAEQVARFRAEVAAQFPAFYSAARRNRTEAEYDALIARAFARHAAIEQNFAARAAVVAGQLADAQADFAKAFPDMKAMPPTYLVHSLGEMDGGTRDLGGRTVLIFGADVIARAHAADANERPFFEHELFHVYHTPLMAACQQVWCALWEEGLATYVSAVRNPGAKPAELLLPEVDMKLVEVNRTAAVCAVRKRATSTADADYNALFVGGSNLPGLPERAGYFVGYLVAAQLGKNATIQQMAAWPEAESREKVLATLADMAPDCPP
jgi:hypothetical protein